ncbi:hypothetical protein U4E84_01555 [Halorubrum sp. AD140]|uniref:hypothetical protein n=1 Tax=Halorubrum sp. AD140 TaxID=3050073 RepID=UPI002ACC7547|nr:hypothetical protein [Halorubrum sp. AD140]MDZ5810041.1 hypothetical protein [Halorubrum sp. AD140]
MDPSVEGVRARVDEHVETYRETAPFYPVEAEAIGSLGDAFRAGDYGRRDVEWVVRWYLRRRVGATDHEERRAIEEAVEDAAPRELREALWNAIDALDGVKSPDDDDPPTPAHHRALDALTDLPGVDVAVGSALLWFLDPDEYLVVGDREWRVVAALTDLDESYPEPVTVEAYDCYLDAVRSLAERLDVDGWRLYMVIQRVHAEAFAGE